MLDTDGVNVFSAPGGFVHITRGALVLIRDESELAGVLAHEVGHVMARHTLRMIHETRLERAFDQGDEMEADRIAVALANHAGYAPAGLGAFLTRLAERNAASENRSGMFASRAEAQARLDRLTNEMRKHTFESTATGQARYTAAVGHTPIPIDAVEAGASGGVNPDRDARGGPNAAAVAVTVTPAEIAEFRRNLSWRP